jgi:hypothetical protein
MQIQQMGRVYSQAASVVVWLGTGNDNSRMALEFLRRVSEEHLDDEAITSIFKAKHIKNTTVKLDLALCETLNGNRYWHRLWIIQEILLGTGDIILCFGRDQISWNIVGKALDRLRQYLNALPPKPDVRDYMKNHDLRVAVEYGGVAILHSIKTMQRSHTPAPIILRGLLALEMLHSAR